MSLDAYIAMEYAPDGDLFSLRGQLTDGVVADLTAQVASGLAHLHAHGVWHRDIKSANILLARGGDGRRVAKIADFGSARAAVVAEAGPTAAAAMPHADSFAMDVDGDWAAASGDLSAKPAAESTARGGYAAPLTRVVATPCYRAPEVVMSRGGYSAAIDAWSLGCVFGELLQVGQRTAAGGTRRAAAAAHHRLPPLSVSLAAPQPPRRTCRSPLSSPCAAPWWPLPPARPRVSRLPPPPPPSSTPCLTWSAPRPGPTLTPCRARRGGPTCGRCRAARSGSRGGSARRARSRSRCWGGCWRLIRRGGRARRKRWRTSTFLAGSGWGSCRRAHPRRHRPCRRPSTPPRTRLYATTTTSRTRFAPWPCSRRRPTACAAALLPPATLLYSRVAARASWIPRAGATPAWRLCGSCSRPSARASEGRASSKAPPGRQGRRPPRRRRHLRLTQLLPAHRGRRPRSTPRSTLKPPRAAVSPTPRPLLSTRPPFYSLAATASGPGRATRPGRGRGLPGGLLFCRRESTRTTRGSRTRCGGSRRGKGGGGEEEEGRRVVVSCVCRRRRASRTLRRRPSTLPPRLPPPPCRAPSPLPPSRWPSWVGLRGRRRAMGAPRVACARREGPRAAATARARAPPPRRRSHGSLCGASAAANQRPATGGRRPRGPRAADPPSLPPLLQPSLPPRSPRPPPRSPSRRCSSLP